MLLSELFDQVNSTFRGSDDDTPVSGTADYTNWLLSTNRKLSEYYRDTKVSRESLFELRSIGTIAYGTQSYDLDDDFLTPSDRVYVTNGDQTLYYTVQKPQERYRFVNSVYISGRDPKVLTFQTDFVLGEQAIGGTLFVPAYFLPDDLSDPGDTVPVDDPYWLVYALAAELAGNDLTYSDKAPDLNAQANNLYAQMITANRKGTSDNPRIAQTNVNRIRDTRGEGYGSSWDNT